MVIPVTLFGVALALGPWFGLESWWWGFSLALCSVAAWRRSPRAGSFWLLLGAVFSLGSWLSTLHALKPGEGVPTDGGRVRLEGEIEAIREGDEGDRWLVAVSRVDEKAVRFRSSLFVTHAPRVVPGQRIIAQTRLKALTGSANPGEWSEQQEQLRRGQTAAGSVDGSRVLVVSGPSGWQRWLSTTHQALTARVESLDEDGDATALLLTLAAGRRAALDDSVEDEFARSGLAHILSVSGLHVAVLALVVLGLFRWGIIRLPWRALRRLEPRRLAAPLAVPWVWAYVLFTGTQAPAVRSAVMCTLMLSAWCFRRRSDALNALAVAAGAMGVLDPSAIFDLSVQLSFVAVAALILLAPWLRAVVPLALPSPATEQGWRLWLARGREAILQTFTASLAVTLASVPLLLSTFQRIGWAGLLSNVVALPLSGVLTLFSAGGAALFVLAPPLSVPVLWAGIQLSKALLLLAHLFALVPGAAVELPGPSWWVAVLWWLGLLAVIFARGRWRAVVLATPLAAVLHVVVPQVVPLSSLEVTFLSVGHGDAIVVSSAGHHLLIDGGGVPQGLDTGRRFVLPFLRQKRIHSFDLAVLSHPHPDHALGLTSTLLEVPTLRLWLPAGAGDGPLVEALREAADDAEVEEVEVGRAPYQLGEATLEVLGPPRDRVLLEGENDRSVVLRLRHGAVTFLFTGDIEEAAEETLEPGPITVLKAPHHGSRTSSSLALLERARPQLVVFSVGVGNRFGFPHPEVAERYQRLSARAYRTDLDGAVTIRSDGAQVSVDTYLDSRARRARAPARHREEQDGQHDSTASE